MDLMAYVPHFSELPHIQKIPTIVHNCEEPKEKDELKARVPGRTLTSKLRRWLLRQRILSRKHPLTRWCLKSTTAVDYEIARHLSSYPYMIHPFSSFRILWESIMTIFAFVALLVTPVFLTFYVAHHGDWHTLNNIMNFVFICDIVIWFFTGYYDYRTKLIVLDHRIVAKKYLRGSFVFDVLPVLPLELLEMIVQRGEWYCATLNLLKILRLRTIVIYSRRLKDVYKINFQLYKMLEMGMIVILCVHWAACLEYFVPLLIEAFSGTNNESWIRSSHVNDETELKKYLVSLNRAMIALCRSAHHLDMKTPEDIILNLILTVIGFLGFIYLLTQFSQLTITFHSTSKRHLKLIQQLKDYMRYKELPHFLQRRLLTFYNYRNKRGFERDRQIMDGVSPYLREKLEMVYCIILSSLGGGSSFLIALAVGLSFISCATQFVEVTCTMLTKSTVFMPRLLLPLILLLLRELILHNYVRLIGSVELFKHLPESITVQLASALKSEIFMTGDEIVKAGTRGDALYFIACGTVAVYTATGKEVCHLEDGSFFGEIALVMESEYRIASVSAVETCEIYVLSRDDFQRFLSPYPDLLHRLQNVALKQLEKTILVEEAYNLESSTSPKHINISSIKGKRRE